MNPSTQRRTWQLAALAVCALLAAGCAGLRCPRIDPSGERIFIWPRDQVPPVLPPTANAQAPPVYTAPVYPPATTPTAGLAGLLPAPPQDRLTISPDRILAPVGSEVILKAGLCTSENFLLTDSKVEWLLARDTVGEFVSLGGRGWCKDPWLPWNKPNKIDNQYAVGYTARVPLQITRGTADTTDDVQIQPGEAWASITSPVEGTTRITAVAPEVVDWNSRRATATIYWVDVQWTFPPATVSGGNSQVLTTTVRRHTDGTPIEGWIVRYEVADGSSNLQGGQSGQSVEVRTDTQGRASIDVTPTGSGGASTLIRTQLVRPARFQGSNAPELVIANGATNVQWTSGASDYVPPPDDLGTPPPVYPIPDSTITPPIQPIPDTTTRRGPVLELEVYTDDGQTEVGKQARFEVVIRNTGDSPATGIRLNDTYDEGLSHIADPSRYLQLERSLNDIAAGETFSEFMTFDVIKPGRLCQNFTVTYNGGASTQKQACIDATQPQQQAQGRLEIRKSGPRLRNVGEAALFTLSIKNVGEAPLTNLEIVDQYDTALQPNANQAGARMVNGSLFWNMPRLEVSETRRFDVTCQCLAPKLEACSTVQVTADTGTLAGAISQGDRVCIEIRPQLGDVTPPLTTPDGGDVLPGVVPPQDDTVVPEGGAGSTPLGLELLTYANPVRAGTKATFQVFISNRTSTSDRQVQLMLRFPAELAPDVTAIQGNVPAQFDGTTGELLFDPINELRANERLEFVVPCFARQPAIRNVTAYLRSQKMTDVLQKTQQIEILGR